MHGVVSSPFIRTSWMLQFSWDSVILLHSSQLSKLQLACTNSMPMQMQQSIFLHDKVYIPFLILIAVLQLWSSLYIEMIYRDQLSKLISLHAYTQSKYIIHIKCIVCGASTGVKLHNCMSENYESMRWWKDNHDDQYGCFINWTTKNYESGSWFLAHLILGLLHYSLTLFSISLIMHYKLHPCNTNINQSIFSLPQCHPSTII